MTELRASFAGSWTRICMMWWFEGHTALSFFFFAQYHIKTAKYRVIWGEIGGHGVSSKAATDLKTWFHFLFS